jgi:hypothetical protein
VEFLFIVVVVELVDIEHELIVMNSPFVADVDVSEEQIHHKCFATP